MMVNLYALTEEERARIVDNAKIYETNRELARVNGADGYYHAQHLK